MLGLTYMDGWNHRQAMLRNARIAAGGGTKAYKAAPPAHSGQRVGSAIPQPWHGGGKPIKLPVGNDGNHQN